MCLTIFDLKSADNLSRRKTLTRSNSITTSYSYDEMSHLTKLGTRNSGTDGAFLGRGTLE